MKRGRGYRLVLVAGIVAVCIWSLFPFYGLIVTSISPRGELPTALFELPAHPTGVFWYEVLVKDPLWFHMRNSVLIGLLATSISMLAAVPAAYSISRFKLRGKETIYLAFLVFHMAPWISLVFPLFLLIRNLGLLDTQFGLAMSYLPWNIALAVWLMRGFLDVIPQQAEEAALVDGASPIQTMFRIVLPQVLPGLAVCSMFIFNTNIIEYIFALTLTNVDAVTLPLKLSGYVTEHIVKWQLVSAAGLVSMIPTVTVYLLVRKYLVYGLSFGMIK